MRSVAYGRRSTGKQEASLEEQRDWIPRAAAHDLALVKVYEDDSICGDDMQRPGLECLLREVDDWFFKDLTIRALIVWDTDRLARASSVRRGGILSALLNAGVERLVTHDRVYNLTSGIDMLLLNVKADFSDSGYVRSLSGNVMRSCLTRAKEAKRPGGRIPMGYVPDGHGNLTPVPEVLAIVREQFELYATGRHSLTDLCRRLMQLGVPSPSGKAIWYPAVLSAILRNRIYRGDFVWFARSVGKYHQVANGEAVAARTSTSANRLAAAT